MLILYHFPRHLIGFCANVGTSAPWILKLLLIGIPFFRIRLRDLLGLNVSLPHLASSSRRRKSHRMAISASVIAVMSSMKARQGGCLVPSSAFGPLYSFDASPTSRFIAAMNKVTDTEHPAIIPLSSCCHFVVVLPDEKRILIPPRCFLVRLMTLSGTW